MEALHCDAFLTMSPKHGGKPCGDVALLLRERHGTVALLADGLGSGLRANLAAQLCVSRLRALLEEGMPLFTTFSHVAQSMNRARGTTLPYAVFVLARVLRDGTAHVLSYDMPEPLLLHAGHAGVLPLRTRMMGKAIVGEAEFILAPGDGVMLFSDGVSQAGMGQGFVHGWGSRGAATYLDELPLGTPLCSLAGRVHDRALELNRGSVGDDTSVVLLVGRNEKKVVMFTGPPANPADDGTVTESFLRTSGAKVVCGATTASLVARVLRREVLVEHGERSLYSPPRSFIEGLDLVTEGAVTLNQVYNILDRDDVALEEGSAVTALSRLLREADSVHILLGGGINPVSGDAGFLLRGILERRSIVPVLAEKLRAMGKFVSIQEV